MQDQDLFSVIDAWARKRPGAPALIDGVSGDVLSYYDLSIRIEHVAGQLAALGVRPGSNIMTFTARSRDLVELVLGASRLDVSVLPFMGATHYGGVGHARSVLQPTHVFFDGVGEGYRQDGGANEIWTPLSELYQASPASIPTNGCDPGRTLYFNASTGTTGVSKLVRATHRQVIVNSRAVGRAFDLEPAHIHLSTFRHHIHELFARGLFTGGTSVILPTAEDPFELIRALKTFKVTHLMAGPRALSVLESALEVSPAGYDLKLIESGGGELWEGLRRHVEELTGAEVLRVWGSTESAGVVFAQRPGKSAERHCVGEPLPEYKVALVDENGKPVNPGEKGELIVSGGGVADAYLVPNSNLQEGVFRTGDILRQDIGHGYTYVGRTNSTFKVAGVRVNGEDIERAIRQTGCVTDTMVLPYPSRSHGHVPVALVVLKSGRRLQNIDADVIADHLNTDLEHPAAFISVSEIPLTIGGKPDRIGGLKLLPSQLPGHSRRWRFKPIKWLRHYWREILGSSVLVRASRRPQRYLSLARRERRKARDLGRDFTE